LQVLSDEENRILLTIDAVLDIHYGNYTLEARNVIDSSRATIELVPDLLSTTTSMPPVVYRLQLTQDDAQVASGNRVGPRSSTSAFNQGTSSSKCH
jgi:hypothetical protein